MSKKVKCTDPIANFMATYWRGEQPLWSAFWVWGMGVGVIMDVIFSTMMRNRMAQSFYDSHAILKFLDHYGIFAMWMLGMMYFAWNFVSVWRCAPNASKPIYGYVARGVYVVFLVAAFMVLNNFGKILAAS